MLLDGPNVRLTAADQMFSRIKPTSGDEHITVGIRQMNGQSIRLVFHRGGKTPIEIDEVFGDGPQGKMTLRRETSTPDVLRTLPSDVQQVLQHFRKRESGDLKVSVKRDRCFLRADLAFSDGEPVFSLHPGGSLVSPIKSLIHLPGLRGNPQRTYPVTAVGQSFPGTFDRYVASVVADWQNRDQRERLNAVGKELERLSLTWKVSSKARRESDTEVELFVGRLSKSVRGGAYDIVSIADVGFGVSQVLPVLVALHVAEQGQLVYVEQPELHLHPRAQHALAGVLCDAAARGVRVIAETHSSILLRGIQALVARGEVAQTLVKLHWFQRGDEDGATRITSAELDDAGAFGPWPEDFAEVELQAESQYLDAVEERRAT